jgi:hypothetical protein
MTTALYVLLQGNPAAETAVAIGSIIAFIGVLLFAWIVWAPAPRHSLAQPAE